VDHLNDAPELAWRHPGFFLDTDGDGHINVNDPDSDDDRLLDGHTVEFTEDDKRYDCYAGVEDACEPYNATDLYHETPEPRVHRHPGELTLGSFPEFTDSDCQATWPDSDTARRCTPSNASGTQGTPGQGDFVNDTAEYRYWANLTDTAEYRAEFPTVDEPWNTSYDGDRVKQTLLDADSDGDGLFDGEEIRGCRVEDGTCQGEEPHTAAWSPDSDGDGLDDDAETAWATGPRDWDSDGDGLPDGWEIWYGLDPLDSADSDEDPDGDGLDNRQEYCRPQATCTYDQRADWCGPSPRKADTDGDETPDPNDAKSYDCHEPSHIGGPSENDQPPYADPNQDLGTLDPQSEEWLRTGKLAQKAAADPANFTTDAVVDPEGLAEDIREAATQDAETVTRLAEPPAAGYQAWRAHRQITEAVEELVPCPTPLPDLDDPPEPSATDDPRAIAPEPAPPPAPGTVEPPEPENASIENSTQPPIDVPVPEPVDAALNDTLDTARCLSDVLQQRGDDAQPVTPEQLATSLVRTGTDLATNVSQPPIEAPPPLNTTIDTPDTENTTLPAPGIDRVPATVAGLDDEVLDPATRHPWSIVNAPDRFPNLVADATGNDRVPDTAFDTISTTDEVIAPANLVATADAPAWDLHVDLADGSTQRIQNIPIGTEHPVHLDEDCPKPVESPTPDCLGDQHTPDLWVELQPTTDDGTGYTFTAEATDNASIAAKLTALVQIPNEERALAMSVDGRRGHQPASEATLGPLPNQFEYTIVERSNATGRAVDLGLDQTDAEQALALGAGLYAVDTHDPDKPALDEPRTELGLVFHEAPDSMAFTARQGDEEDRQRLETTWSASNRTRLVGSLDHRAPEQDAFAAFTLDDLPTQGSLNLRRTDDHTRIRANTTQADAPPDIVRLTGRIGDSDGDTPTAFDLAIDNVPAFAELALDENAQTPNTTIDYEASSAFEHARATIAPADEPCAFPPADNLVVADGACTHLDLTHLQDANVETSAKHLDADWTRTRTGENLTVLADRDGTTVTATLQPWPLEGRVDTRWGDPVQASWHTTPSLERLKATATGEIHGHLEAEGLPAWGNLTVDTDENRFVFDTPNPIEHVQAQLTTNEQVPDDPGGDHAILDTIGNELQARLDLHDLDASHATFAPDRASLNLSTSEDRSLTVHATTPNANVRAHVDEMPGYLAGDLERQDANTTLRLDRAPNDDAPTIDANGNLDGRGFALTVADLPRTTNGFVDTDTGEVQLDASHPFTVDAYLASDTEDPPTLMPVSNSQPGVSFDLQRPSNEPHGAEIHLEAIEQARIHRTNTGPGPDPIQGTIHVAEPTPLAIASVDADTTTYAQIRDVPANTRFDTTFNDAGGEFDWTASHPVDNVTVLREAPNTTFEAHAQGVPRSIQASWTNGSDNLEGTLDHSAEAPISKLGFRWIDDQDTPNGTRRTARGLLAESVPSPVTVTFTDGHQLDADLGTTDRLDHVAALYANNAPVDKVTVPNATTHGVHYRNLDDGQSLGLRFDGPHSIHDARIPNRTQPVLDIDTTLAEPHPLHLYVNDTSANTSVDVRLGQLGGGPIDLDGRLATTAGSPRLELDAQLPTPVEHVRFDHQNATGWYHGDLDTAATNLAAHVTPARINVEADEPVTGTIEGAPDGEDAPTPAPTGTYAKINTTGSHPVVGAHVANLTEFTFDAETPNQGRLAWNADSEVPFTGAYYGPNLTIEDLTVHPLSRRGTVEWDTSAGFDATWDLTADIDHLETDVRYNATGTPEPPNATIVADATLDGLAGTGEATFRPNDSARLILAEGLDRVEGQVLVNPADNDTRLDELDERAGLVLDEPDEGDYDTAIAVNLTHLQTLEATIHSTDDRFLVDGTAQLSQPIDEALFLRSRTAQAFVNATASNLPETTSFRVDTPQTNASNTRTHAAFDWGNTPVDDLKGNLRKYEDDAGDLQANFTGTRVTNLTVEVDGSIDENLDGHVGASLDRGYVRLEDETEDGTERLRAALTADAHQAPSVYDVSLENAGETGHVNLREESPPLDRVRLEVKKGNDTTQHPENTLDDGNRPQWLIAEPSTVTDERYLHARAENPTEVRWNANETTGLDATFNRQGSPERTYIQYQNDTHHANVTIADLPNQTRVGFADESTEKRFAFETSDPIDVPLLSYRNQTSGDEGVPAQDGTPVNLQVTGRDIEDLEDTTITVENFEEGKGNVTVHADGLDHARLFGVFRGPNTEPGRAQHLFAELGGVPDTRAHLEYHANDESDVTAPYVSFDSRQAIERGSISFLNPVDREPAAITYPDTPSPEYVNLHTRTNSSLDDGPESSNEQLKVQANLTNVERASVDPETELEQCPDCRPMTVELGRDRPGEPLFVNLNASMVPVNGTLLTESTPETMQLQFGTDEQSGQDGDAKSSKIEDAHVAYDASGPMEDTEINLTFQHEDTPIDVAGTIDTFPEHAMFDYQRDARGDDASQTCGFDFAQRLPGSVQVQTEGGTLDGVNLTMTPGDADTVLAAPDDAHAYAGLQTGDEGPHARLVLEDTTSLSLTADPTTEPLGELQAGYHLDAPGSLVLDVVKETDGDNQVYRIDTSTPDARTTLTCSEKAVSVDVGQGPGQDTTIDQIEVNGSGLQLFGRETTAFEGRILDLKEGVTVDLDPARIADDHPSNGIAVTGPPDASMKDVELTANFPAPSDSEIAECQAETEDESSDEDGNDTRVRWAIPTEFAEFGFTTTSTVTGTPAAPNWYLDRDTCEEYTVAGELHDVENVHAAVQDEPDIPIVSAWANVTNRAETEVLIERPGEDTDVAARVEIDKLPHEFWLHVPDAPRKAEVGLSDEVGRFSIISRDCTNVWMQDIEPTHGDLLWAEGIGLEYYGRLGGCNPARAAQLGASAAASIKVSASNAVESIGKFVVELTDGATTVVDAAWEGMKSDLEWWTDLDGWSQQRTEPRAQHLDVDMGGMDVTVSTEEEDEDETGTNWRWDGPRIEARTQPDWHDQGSNSDSRSHVPGTVDFPERVIENERDCIDRAESGQCEEHESTSKVHLDVAEKYLDDSFTFWEGSDDPENVPAREWAEAVR